MENEDYDPKNKIKSLEKRLEENKTQLQIQNIDISDIHGEIFSRLELMQKL